MSTRTYLPDCVAGGVPAPVIRRLEREKKLHVGYGKEYLLDYKRLDLIDYGHIDIICAARNLKMIESVSKIYSRHIFGYLECNEVAKILREWGGGIEIEWSNQNCSYKT